MNIPYLKISVLLLSLSLTAGAMADNGRANNGGGFWNRFNGGDAQRKDELARKEELLNKQRERQLSKQLNQNRLLDSCSDAQRDGEHACGRADSAQKGNRLTPDERRALRRQIQDAGHELYAPVR
ncbi:hypothetical protein H8L32_01805 [Undibacterium sp. CY18W]|uniref:Uncharacterized protein n=1 Tax=Undibacterium hunanense TaxID=2762292 RepID=A0ABR6ZK94_9BURK|nr:hypothetical protein [Undibacterium hunanense]MBC3916209.1 hypothetical protein [Undibacterium hunanense]